MAQPTCTPAPAGGDIQAERARGDLVVRAVTKRFGSTTALDAVSMTFTRGAVHGLVGENGSGKSTLVKLIAGIHRCDGGDVLWDDESLVHGQARSADAVACVYQDGSLIEELSVGQNLDLMVPSGPGTQGTDGVDWRRALLDSFGLYAVGLSSRVAALPSNERRLVEIAGVVAARPSVILFDEATSSLDERGVERVLASMTAAAAAGACVVFVTHRLHEVLAVAEDVTVLRDGRVIATRAAAEVTASELVDHMAGREVAAFGRSRHHVPGSDVVLVAEGLTTERCRGVAIAVRRGEIVGIGGAAGNGQAELIRALTGVGVTGGAAVLNGEPVCGPENAVSRGLVFVSADRARESLSGQLSIRENYTLASDSVRGHWWTWLARRPELRAAVDLADRYGLVRGSVEQPVSSLSGGNQQKVAISRAIARRPEVLLVEEPTEGVDVRSRFEIYRALEGAAASGSTVVFTSTDAGELRLLADRVLVMVRGQVYRELHGEEVTEEAIVHAFTTGTSGGDSGTGAPARNASRADTPVSGERTWQIGTFVLLLAMMALLAVYTTSQSSDFLSGGNIRGMLVASSPLALVALAQLPILVVGEIDASLGSVMGLVVVMLSMQPDAPLVVLVVLAIVTGALLGVGNAVLVVGCKIPPVIATVATLGIYLGLARIARPSPGGLVSGDLTSLTLSEIGGVPVVFLLAALLALLADLVLNLTGLGLRSRAVGYSASRSLQLGIPSARFRVGGFVLGGAVAGLAAIPLAGITGVGDASIGSGYTLLAVAVPVIAGASLGGGRGSALACVLAAVFLAQVQTVVPFLNLPSGQQLIAVGVLTLVALVLGRPDQKPLLRSLRPVRRSAGPATPPPAPALRSPAPTNLTKDPT
ncbi:MAG: hypothetical protein JWM64_967 [Frankiales bacterium]|nr:hypothetical protein [Frankiales bacterium]